MEDWKEREKNKCYSILKNECLKLNQIEAVGAYLRSL